LKAKKQRGEKKWGENPRLIGTPKTGRKWESFTKKKGATKTPGTPPEKRLQI